MNAPARLLKIEPPEEQGEVLLEISPFQSDGGERVGRVPADVPSEILSLYYRTQNPLKAIRARCLDCCCGSANEVRKCVLIGCPSWPFRMGKNPFRVKRQLSDKQKRDMADRLGKAGETLLRVIKQPRQVLP